MVQATAHRTGDRFYDRSVSVYDQMKVTPYSKTLNIQFIEVLAKDEKQVFDNVTVESATNAMGSN